MKVSTIKLTAITHVYPNALGAMPCHRSIISGTKVTSLKDMLFANLVNCTAIDLSNNQIATVEGTPFAGLIK